MTLNKLSILGHPKLLNSLAGIGSWSACKHYNKDLSKNRKASQPWLPSQESYAFIAPSVFSHISEFLPWIKMNSPDVSTVVFYALFFFVAIELVVMVYDSSSRMVYLADC